MPTLYEINELIRSALRIEDTEQRELALRELELDFNEKCINLGLLIRELQGDIEAAEAEQKRLHERELSFWNKQNWLKEYLNVNMKMEGQEKIKTALISISVKKNPISCIVSDASKIPEKFTVLIPEERKPDKKLLIDNFKDTGETFDGVEFITDKTHVEVK